MRISDWSSDVCSSDLQRVLQAQVTVDERSVGQIGTGLLVFVCAEPADDAALADRLVAKRSEERRVGKECASTCRSRWSTYHYKKTVITKEQNNTIHIRLTIRHT